MSDGKDTKTKTGETVKTAAKEKTEKPVGLDPKYRDQLKEEIKAEMLAEEQKKKDALLEEQKKKQKAIDEARAKAEKESKIGFFPKDDLFKGLYKWGVKKTEEGTSGTVKIPATEFKLLFGPFTVVLVKGKKLSPEDLKKFSADQKKQYLKEVK